MLYKNMPSNYSTLFFAREKVDRKSVSAASRSMNVAISAADVTAQVTSAVDLTLQGLKVTPKLVTTISETVIGGLGLVTSVEQFYSFGVRGVYKSIIRKNPGNLLRASLITGFGGTTIGLSITDMLTIFGIGTTSVGLTLSLALMMLGTSSVCLWQTALEARNSQKKLMQAKQELEKIDEDICTLQTAIAETPSRKKSFELKKQLFEVQPKRIEAQKAYKAAEQKHREKERELAYASLDVVTSVFSLGVAIFTSCVLLGLVSGGVVPTVLIVLGGIIAASAKIFDIIDARNDRRYSTKIYNCIHGLWHKPKQKLDGDKEADLLLPSPAV
jgi:hypothetical protein